MSVRVCGYRCKQEVLRIGVEDKRCGLDMRWCELKFAVTWGARATVRASP